jgi:hypothetical protein
VSRLNHARCVPVPVQVFRGTEILGDLVTSQIERVREVVEEGTIAATPTSLMCKGMRVICTGAKVLIYPAGVRREDMEGGIKWHRDGVAFLWCAVSSWWLRGREPRDPGLPRSVPGLDMRAVGYEHVRMTMRRQEGSLWIGTFKVQRKGYASVEHAVTNDGIAAVVQIILDFGLHYDVEESMELKHGGEPWPMDEHRREYEIPNEWWLVDEQTELTKIHRTIGGWLARRCTSKPPFGLCLFVSLSLCLSIPSRHWALWCVIGLSIVYYVVCSPGPRPEKPGQGVDHCQMAASG